MTLKPGETKSLRKDGTLKIKLRKDRVDNLRSTNNNSHGAKNKSEKPV